MTYRLSCFFLICPWCKQSHIFALQRPFGYSAWQHGLHFFLHCWVHNIFGIMAKDKEHDHWKQRRQYYTEHFQRCNRWTSSIHQRFSPYYVMKSQNKTPNSRSKNAMSLIMSFSNVISLNPTKCLWRGSPTVGPTSSSVRLHIYVPSHIWLKYR